MSLTTGKKLIFLGAALVVLDQVTKILVKTNMCLGESSPVFGDFLRICFVENEGMAFGMKWGGVVGKILLSTFRPALFGFLCWWMSRLVRRRNADIAAGQVPSVPVGVLVGLALIAAGAFGNIIDCWFYGLVFSASGPVTIASFGGSYAPFMMGRVVDMISFSFFPPVFNVADSCVSVGAVYLVLFHWKFFSKD